MASIEPTGSRRPTRLAVGADLAELQRFTDAALAHLALGDLLRVLLDRVTEILDADTAAILLLDDDGRVLRARAAKGIEEEVEQDVRIPVGKGFAGRVAANGSRSPSPTSTTPTSSTRSCARRGSAPYSACRCSSRDA